MTRRLKLVAAVALALSALWAVASKPPRVDADLQPTQASTNVRQFLEAHCYACHNTQTKKGDLDLTALKLDLDDPKAFATWVKVHDRVLDGEMPPKGMPRPDT